MTIRQQGFTLLVFTLVIPVAPFLMALIALAPIWIIKEAGLYTGAVRNIILSMLFVVPATIGSIMIWLNSEIPKIFKRVVMYWKEE